MSIESARVKVNDVWTSLTYNDGTEKWEGQITAPNVTSFNQAGGYYPVTIEATNSAETTATVDPSDASLGDSLKLVVKETVKPVITIVSPTAGAYLTNNKPAIVVTVTDEVNGSGVDPDTFKLTVDSTVYTQDSAGMVKTTIANGYQFTFTPGTALSDGSHTIKADCSDNDGNAAVQKTVTATIDTTPPVLTVSSPENGLVTASASCIVRGVTNDQSSSPVSVTIKVNDGAAESVSVGSDGAFEKTVTLLDGLNTIVVTATDSAGKSSSVTRTVTLDTSVPTFSDLTISPNPANTSGSVIISVKIE